MNKDLDILLERAKKIAGRKKNKTTFSEEAITIVEFLLLPERYALEEKYISEVLFLKDITPIPGTPPFVMGVINLRGRIISIINLKSLFSLKEKGLTELNRVMILKNETMEFGIVADSISGNSIILTNTLSPPPLTLDHFGAEFVTGITPDGLIFLNASSLLSSNHVIINK